MNKINNQLEESWRKFFNEDYLLYGPYLRSNKQTADTVGGIIELVNIPKTSKILDLCCGYGRISQPLAQKGFNIVGVDGSKALINQAEKNRVSQNINNLKYISADAREITFEEEFEAVINIGGAFGYANNENEDFKILQKMYKSLKNSGKILMELHSRDGHVYSLQKKQYSVPMGDTYMNCSTHFNLLSSKWEYKFWWKYEGLTKNSSLSFTLYTPKEIVNMLYQVGFRNIKVYGGWDKSELTHINPSMLVLAEK